MIDYPALSALSAVLRSGSFDRAAAQLGVTQSAISQRIKGLEDKMGATLIIRGTPCTATPMGERLLRHADDVALIERRLMTDLAQPTDTRPTLRIATNADSLATWVIPALGAVTETLFDLVIDDQDHSADWLQRGAVVAAITARAAPVAGCDSIPLGALRYLPTATPDFARRWFENGVTADALTRAPVITFNAKDRLQHQWAERLTGTRVAMPCHIIGSTHGFRDAALAGLGWGMNPEPLVQGDLAAGRLVALSDTPLDTPLYWQISRAMAGPLRPLTRAIRQAAQDWLISTTRNPHRTVT